MMLEPNASRPVTVCLITWRAVAVFIASWEFVFAAENITLKPLDAIIDQNSTL